MPRIVLSIALIIVIVAWVVFLQRKLHKELKADDGKPHSIQKSYVSADVLLQGVEKLTIAHSQLADLKTAVHEQIIGMDGFINAILVTLLAGGHALVEGVPGLAKTKTIGIVADLLGLDFNRIQFTPDMLPSDIVGVDIFNPDTRSFEPTIGPVMTHILLADEINRTTPKVQSALLESMQERQVTIGGKTIALPDPFFVLATQNPLEQEGTYPLPEAQIDRFLCKVIVDYPSLDQEKEMLNKSLEVRSKPRSEGRGKNSEKKKEKIFSCKELLAMHKEVTMVSVPSSIKDYIARIVQETRTGHSPILYGSSPRGSLALMQAAQAVAYMQGHDTVAFADVHAVVLLVLRHRIVLTYDARLQHKNEDIILSEIVQCLPL